MHPVAGSLSGTYADSLRQAYLRVHFMNALLTDSRVAVLFDDWGRQTGLYAAADAVAQPMQQLAEAIGAPQWAAITKQIAGETDGRPFAAAQSLLAALGEEQLPAPSVAHLKRLCHKANDFLRILGENRLTEPRPAEFVRVTLGLRWAWLAYELVDSFYRYLQTRAFGLVEERVFSVEHKSPPAPPLTWSVNFKTSAGETVHEAEVRLADVVTEASEALYGVVRSLDNAASKALGRRPKSDTRYLQDWAQWFYRARVRQPPESQRSIAMGPGLDRRTIRRGIRNVERLLGLGKCTLRD